MLQLTARTRPGLQNHGPGQLICRAFDGLFRAGAEKVSRSRPTSFSNVFFFQWHAYIAVNHMGREKKSARETISIGERPPRYTSRRLPLASLKAKQKPPFLTCRQSPCPPGSRLSTKSRDATNPSDSLSRWIRKKTRNTHGFPTIQKLNLTHTEKRNNQKTQRRRNLISTSPSLHTTLRTRKCGVLQNSPHRTLSATRPIHRRRLENGDGGGGDTVSSTPVSKQYCGAERRWRLKSSPVACS